jgi:hypothetical protein
MVRNAPIFEIPSRTLWYINSKMTGAPYTSSSYEISYYYWIWNTRLTAHHQHDSSSWLDIVGLAVSVSLGCRKFSSKFLFPSLFRLRFVSDYVLLLVSQVTSHPYFGLVWTTCYYFFVWYFQEWVWITFCLPNVGYVSSHVLSFHNYSTAWGFSFFLISLQSNSR